MASQRGRHRSWLAVLASCLLLLAGCSDGDDAASETEQTAQEIFDGAAVAMADIETASFVLEQVGAPVAIDEQGQLLFQAATGRIARPSSADAIVTVEALGFTTEVGAIAIDGMVWFTNPLTGDWTEAPAGFAFDPAALFDPEEGFAGLLAEAASTARFVPDGEQDPADDPQERDDPFHRIEADISAERVEVLTSGLIGAATTIDTWIDTESGRLVQVRFEVPIGEEISDWRMFFTDYNGADVIITPPELADTGS